MSTPEADIPMLSPAPLPIMVDVDFLEKHLDIFVAELKKASDAHTEWDKSVTVSDKQEWDTSISPDVHDEVKPRFTDFFKTWTTACKVSDSTDKFSSPQGSMDILLPYLETILSDPGYKAPTLFTDLKAWSTRSRHLASSLAGTSLKKGCRATVVKRYSTGVAKSLMSNSEAYRSLWDMACGLDGLTVDAIEEGFATQKYRAYLGGKLQDAQRAASVLSTQIKNDVPLDELSDEGRTAHRTMLDLFYAVAITAPDPAPNPDVAMTAEEERHGPFINDRIAKGETGEEDSETEWGDELIEDQSYEKEKCVRTEPESP